MRIEKIAETLNIICGGCGEPILNLNSALQIGQPGLSGGTRIFTRFQSLCVGYAKNDQNSYWLNYWHNL